MKKIWICGGPLLDISDTARTSFDTGYSWSGYDTAWGIAITEYYWSGGKGLLEFSGVNIGYDNWNAWTAFGGDYVANLTEINLIFYWKRGSVPMYRGSWAYEDLNFSSATMI